MTHAVRRTAAHLPVAGLIAALLFAALPVAANSIPREEIPLQLRQAITSKLLDRIKEAVDKKNEQGDRYKRGVYSSRFEKLDDSTYAATIQIDTAEPLSMTTERIRLTLDVQGRDNISIREQSVEDTYTALHRPSGSRCYSFDSFNFEREGMKMSSGPGDVCEQYFMGGVYTFGIGSPTLEYTYSVPKYISAIDENHQYHDLERILKSDHGADLVFSPSYFGFSCDAETCDEILDGSFTGLTRVAADQRDPASEADVSGVHSGLRSRMEKDRKDLADGLKDNPFHGFRRPDKSGHRYYNAFVFQDEDEGIGIAYDNLDGYEVQFIVVQDPDSIDPEAINGPVFGYYTEETLANYSLYELENRDDLGSREYEVYSVKGTVDAGVDDPEWVKADIEFGITVKETLKELPFFIANVPSGDAANYRRPSLSVNSIQMDGKDLTWIKTNPYGGLIVLPEEVPAGETIYVSMDFGAKAIRKYNVAFSQLARFGWMPFVRFADFIDEFEMTIRTPPQYKILGIGERIEEKVENGVRVSRWSAESPVVFPSIIFGKYYSDDSSKAHTATKLDGKTVIPVNVHVDEVSLTDWDIRTKQLRPIATQAAVSIDIFKDLSGVDYPYGELNLVNDPLGSLYGQAPSSLIYLGSAVFRGEGTLGSAGGTGTAKFLKSVTAHEVGHQWWGSRVSNKNNRNYWFVETLAEYFSAIYLETVFGKKAYDEQVSEWRLNVLDRRMKSSVQEASALWSGEDGFGSYQSAVYNKGPMAFHMLRQTFGDEKFFDALKKMSMELAEKREIVTRDIQHSLEKAFGGTDPEGQPYNVDLEWFFDQWIRGIGIPQFAVQYDVRETEDGQWLIEGTVKQRVVIGSQRDMKIVEGAAYRGVVDLVVDARGGQKYGTRIVMDGPESAFRLKVKEKPLEVALNESDGMLAHDVLDNRDF